MIMLLLILMLLFSLTRDMVALIFILVLSAGLIKNWLGAVQ